VYDTGAGESSSNYLGFQLDRVGTHERNSIFGNDYDFSGGTYSLNPNDHDTLSTGVERTQGWHQFLVDITLTQATFKIDGVTVYTKPGIARDRIFLFMQVPSWRPAWVSYFDDFAYVPYLSVTNTNDSGPGSLSAGHSERQRPPRPGHDLLWAKRDDRPRQPTADRH
jgi:hypothetical protein